MQHYLKQIQKNLGYRATWEPQRPMSIGTYGKIHQGVFSEYGHLDEFKIPLSIDKSKTNHQLTYKSENKGSYTLKAKGELNPLFKVLTADEAGLLLIFKKDNGIDFNIQGLTYFHLKNKVEIALFLEKLTLTSQWDPNYLIISETVQAEKSTIFLSKKKLSEIEVKFDGFPDNKKIGLTSIDLSGEVVRSQGLSLQFKTTTLTTPLYKLSRLKSAVLVPSKNKNVSIPEKPELTEIAFDISEMNFS
jgi:hypothetical protein